MKTLIMPILSPERHLRWQRAFKPVDVMAEIVIELATLTSIFKLYVTRFFSCVT
jgi:hypothetical protein